MEQALVLSSSVCLHLIPLQSQSALIMQRHALFIGNAHLLLATASVCITPFPLSRTVIHEFGMKSHDLHLLNLILL